MSLLLRRVSLIARRTLTGFVGTTGVTNDTQVSVTPTGQQEDDRLIAWVCSVGGANTISGPTDWTEITPQVTQGTTTVGSLWQLRGRPAEAGPYVWTGSQSRRMVVIVVAYHSLVAGEIVVVDGTQASGEGANAQQLDHNSLTPSGALRWHLLGTCSNSSAPDDDLVTLTQPAGYDELAEASSEHASNANVHAALADRELPTAAATGVQTVSITGGTNRQLVGLEVLLATAGTGPPPLVISQYASLH